MSSRTNVPGAALAYRLDGPDDAPTVMLAHGLAADMSMWDDNVGAFAGAYRVLRYDMRGHGLSSSPPAPYTAAVLADDAIALLDALRIDRVHFVGLSLGGIVGQHLGARYPNRLSSLSLCSTMSRHSDLASLEERVLRVRAGGMRAVVDGTIERWFTPAFARRSPDTIARVREMVLNTRVNGFVGCASAVRDLPQASMLSQIRIPTLIVTGQEDKTATVEVAREMHALVRNSELFIVADAARLPNIEQPRAFNAAVLSFLSRSAAGLEERAEAWLSARATPQASAKPS